MSTTEHKTGRIVFVATHDWWEQRGEDFEVADDWNDEAMAVAGVNPDFEESFAATVLDVDPVHIAIKPGDIVCSDGYGEDKIFVRFE